MIGAATAWLVLAAASPSPGPTTAVDNGPTENQFNGSGDSYSAGLYAFLIIVAIAACTALIIFFMNRSLRRARHNLGGDVLPRRERDQIPVGPGEPGDAGDESPPPADHRAG